MFVPTRRTIWFEQLRRAVDLGDAEQRRLSHELLEAVANDRDEDAEDVASRLGRRAGLGSLPAA